MPGVSNYTERGFAKMLIELRDSEITTYSYYMDRDAGLHFLCNSVGYGIPYAVQYVNPERYAYNGATIPQPEPNGLFMPDALTATWVLCSDASGTISPIYWEPELIVSPFRLPTVN